MSTKSEQRAPLPRATDAITKVVNGDATSLASTNDSINGFEENGVCEQQQHSHDIEQQQHVVGSAPACSTVNLENGVIAGAGELSPSALRRSTRACALRAAERIKLKESLTPIIDGLASQSGEGYVSGDDDLDEGKRPAKKRRMASGYVLDQSNCKFGIKLEGDEVLLMSDESEVSSLNDFETEQLKKSYEKILHRDMPEEQRRERELLLKAMEADLRLEEAKLMMLKKLRLSQQVSVRQLQDANVRKMTANVAQNGSGNAYKPPVATPPTRSVGCSHNTVHPKASTSSNTTTTSSSSASALSSRNAINTAAALMKLTQQQQQMLQNAAKSGLLNSAAAQAILQQAQQHAQSNGRMNHHHHQQQQQQASAALSQQQQSRLNAIAQSTARESAVQKAAAAKLALRRQLEQQLLQIPPPRPPPPEMQFIPNGSQPDFCYLLGLDIAVQRLLKDKNATKHVSEGPYICEECGTDYTPLWRAIGANEDSLHLYCEACVKAAQKKKMRQDHTALLRKAFNKVLEKEQELEKEIAEGKYETIVPSSSTPRSATPVATPPPKHATKTTPNSGISTSNLKTSASSSALLHQQTKSQAHKRPASNAPNIGSPSVTTQNVAAAAAAAAIAAAAGGTTSSNLLQQQMAAAAFRHTNPMLAAAMMANPLLSAPNMLQMQWNPLMQQRLPNLAMAALAQAVQSAQQSNAAAAGSGAAAAAAANPLAALAASMNPAAAAALFNNPQMARQLQQVYQASQRNFLLEYAKSQIKK
ncbi:unnamed protein product [Anisakis simplex]|uniref:GATA-type domain-containing protein n=1 Tax=Anisakis simplex TaxID=6269 RepID=A0A0M3JUJ7_ANISI|nr:unnamed protein product [Anisakis simplex]